ncbi:TolC family protein [Colwellia sp. 1_MG-2023]|uniref:efflux transporter outer membrane subunit n=1 Tax=Colwellia sp. 1_MG-2023 TaxID=3062649 RepID=UPI0026E198E1|nr:TolC family protein [Colwellia sp. 1_MG-2023]MDO6446021.1 TolC family protein [Colwellia sp. 1_MG-2023]
MSCSSTSGRTEASRDIVYPQHWQSIKSQISDDAQSSDNWITTFNDPQLIALVEQAIKQNRLLKTQKITMKLAEQKALVSGASRLPALTLNQGNSRRKNVSDDVAQYTSSADVDLELSLEVDIWGKLSDQQNQATLNFAAAKSTYEHQKTTLIAQVASAWFDVISAQELLNLYQERAKNLTNNLEMIQASYRLGLNDALDVYLTQNDVSQESARVAQQQQVLSVAKRQLELLIGEYPDGNFTSNVALPVLNQEVLIGAPAQLLTKRHDILTSWYQLLALDAGLAVSHKQRFPKISLFASTGDSSDELQHLLDGSSLAWSLIGNLTLPLFDGGRLASLEKQARLEVEQQEQYYLNDLYQAFADVENNIANSKALKERYQHLTLASQNALTAEKLSFDQYMRGLVSYTTVLESQRRAFDAQNSLIQLTNQLLQNRISLFVSLGGSPVSQSEESNNTSTIVANNQQVNQ